MKRLILLIGVLFATGTPTPISPVAARPTNTSPAELQARTKVNAIGPELLATHLRHDGVANAMVSSPLLFYALSLLALGADGTSLDLLGRLLLADRGESLAAVAPPLAAALTREVAEDSSHGAFRISHSLWSAHAGNSSGRGFVFMQDFIAAAEAIYGASHRRLDFTAPGASQVINDWTDEQTRGLIPVIMNDRLLSTLQWVILNTGLFEGTWGTPMRHIGADDPYRFMTLDGTHQAAETIRTQDFMSRVVDLNDGSVVFQLPFAGRNYAFLVHVPPPDHNDIRGWLLDAAVPGLPGMVDRLLAGEGTLHQLSIQLPVFAFSDNVTINADSPIAQDLGLVPLFDSRANLSQLSEQPTRVAILKQDTRIELDEKGVRAAAATFVGGMRSTSVQPNHPKREIVVNRPFAFAIVERTSRTLLFNGVVVSPE